jgi:uncharacterized protein
MKRTLSIILAGIFVIATLAACSTPANVQVTTSPVLPSLSSSGLGEVYLAPDIAYINIGVHTQAPEVSTAMSDNIAQAQQVADALKALGVEAKDIQTTNFNVYPMNTYDTMGQITGTYYSVDNTVYVTVRDLSQLGVMLDAVVKSGANNINGISFDIADKSAAIAQAQDLAIKDAKAQAEAIATSAGVKLGKVQSISVSSNNYASPVYEGKGGAAMNSATVPVSAGQLLVSVNAYITYEINQ